MLRERMPPVKGNDECSSKSGRNSQDSHFCGISLLRTKRARMAHPARHWELSNYFLGSAVQFVTRTSGVETLSGDVLAIKRWPSGATS